MRTEKLKTQSQFNGRLDIAEEKINELEDRIKESIQNAAGETKRLSEKTFSKNVMMLEFIS